MIKLAVICLHLTIAVNLDFVTVNLHTLQGLQSTYIRQCTKEFLHTSRT